MKRIHLRRRKNFKKNLIIIIVITLIIAIISVLRFIGNSVVPRVTNYAELQASKITKLVISKSLSKDIVNLLDSDNLFKIEKNNNGEIGMVEYNTATVTNIILNANTIVEENLKRIEEGNFELLNDTDLIYDIYVKKDVNQGIIYQIPLLAFLNNPFFTNIGPQIPIRLNFIGSVSSNLKSDVKEYGINSALISTYINIEVTMQVNMPIRTSNITVSQTVPISYKIISGKVPNYYLGTDLLSNTQ